MAALLAAIGAGVSGYVLGLPGDQFVAASLGGISLGVGIALYLIERDIT